MRKQVQFCVEECELYPDAAKSIIRADSLQYGIPICTVSYQRAPTNIVRHIPLVSEVLLSLANGSFYQEPAEALAILLFNTPKQWLV
jgi:hypothetical protein